MSRNPNDAVDEALEDLDALIGEAIQEPPNSVIGTVQQLVDRYTHCSICGAHLHFSHLTDFARNLTQETARCPECGIKTRNQTFRLQ